MLLRYFVAWFGMMIIAILNGAIRDGLYKSRVGDLAAHQISTVILLCILAGYFWLLTSIWHIASSLQAWAIGLMWLVMTLAFEVGMGRLILKKPWGELRHDYNIFAGRVWVLIPLWTLIGPYVCFRLKQGG